MKGANTTLETLHEMRGKGDFTTVTMLEKNLAVHVLLVALDEPELHRQVRAEAALADVIDDGFGAAKRRVPPADVRGCGHHPGLGVGACVVGAGGQAHRRAAGVQPRPGRHGQGTVPRLAIDSWEHAYYLQYENRKAEYLDVILARRQLGRRRHAVLRGSTVPSEPGRRCIGRRSATSEERVHACWNGHDPHTPPSCDPGS